MSSIYFIMVLIMREALSYVYKFAKTIVRALVILGVYEYLEIKKSHMHVCLVVFCNGTILQQRIQDSSIWGEIGLSK